MWLETALQGLEVAKALPAIGELGLATQWSGSPMGETPRSGPSVEGVTFRGGGASKGFLTLPKSLKAALRVAWRSRSRSRCSNIA